MRTFLLAGTALALAAAPALAQDQVQGQPRTQEYTADYTGELQGLNGVDASGTVSLKTTQGGRLVMSVGARGLPPGMHLAHIHGFTTQNPQEASCPGQDADANGDGVIDLMETEQAAGKTLIPFTDNPASLQIKAETYPTADQDGTMSWIEDTPLDALEQAVRQQYGTPLALETRVVFIHGAAQGTELPDTAASLEGVAARVTLPIACAELERKPIER